jgi:hypothetical protein
VRNCRQAQAFSDFEGDIVSYSMRYRCDTEIIGPFGQVAAALFPLVELVFAAAAEEELQACQMHAELRRVGAGWL